MEPHAYEQKLSTRLKVDIADIYGYPCAPFGNGVVIFQLTRIVLSDGRALTVQSEHHTPYLCANNTVGGLTEEELEADRDKE